MIRVTCNHLLKLLYLVQTASAQCSLQTLCLEMKIVVIGCGTVAVAAIIGFVFIACRGSKREFLSSWLRFLSDELSLV